MIRSAQPVDIEPMLELWLDASIEAHPFVPASFWRTQLANMRTHYLPTAENHVAVHADTITGFYSLHGDTLAALFVHPDRQGHGIGRALLSDARSRRQTLTLSVYQANMRAVGFYRAHGLHILREQIDPHTGQPEYLMGTEPLSSVE